MKERKKEKHSKLIPYIRGVKHAVRGPDVARNLMQSGLGRNLIKWIEFFLIDLLLIKIRDHGRSTERIEGSMIS